MKRPALLRSTVAVLLATGAVAQSNVIPGTDVSLGILGGLSALGRQGAFPDGVNALVMATTSCNAGTVDVPWLQAMSEDHPFIAFLMARESNGRLVQISDRSFVKHGFFAQSGSLCTPCQNPSPGTFLGVGCSDVYSTSNNGNNFWLAPPEEIDPWLGTWTAQCSYFDMGNPPVGGAAGCDGVRSFSGAQASALGPVGNRMRVLDADLNQPGTFWYQGQYVIRGEPVGNRFNNLASREVVPTWNGFSWSTSEPGAQLDGSVLQRWTGATVNFTTNGADDGHVWVAAVATPLPSGLWHWEFALHNVDNQRAFDELRIPIAPGTSVSNTGFHDIDSDAGNDWQVAVAANEIVFSTGTNPVGWNTFYNFWFDADSGPLADSVTVGQFLAGAGADELSVQVPVPLDPCGRAQSYCTAKIDSQLCAPTIAATGSASATPGSAFDVGAQMVLSNVPGLLFYGAAPAALPFEGGTLCVQPPLQRTAVQVSGGNPPPRDCSGSFLFDMAAEIQTGHAALAAGATAYAQYWYRDAAAPVQPIGLSDALWFEICP